MSARAPWIATFIASILLVVGPHSFAQEIDDPTGWDNSVVAHLLEVPVKIGEFDKGMRPSVFRNHIGPGEDARAIAFQHVVNSFRAYALPRLAVKLMPNCQIDATAADIEAFYPYWRRVLKDNIVRSPELADRTAIAKADAERARGIADLTFLPHTSHPDMLNVSSDTPGAEGVARRLIREWRIYACVQTNYGGEIFFSPVAGSDGTEWSSSFPICAEAVDDQTHAIPTPCLDLAEPIGGLGKLFHDAKDRGMLKFSFPRIDEYFFERYDGDQFANVKEVEKVKAWFAAPPWLQGQRP